MAEDKNKINPSTGIADFARDEPEEKLKNLSDSEWRSKVYQEAVKQKKQEMQPQQKIRNPEEQLKFRQKGAKVEKKIKEFQLSKKMPTAIGSFFTPRKARPLKDRLKVMRLQNMLDKKRLQNEIQKLKLQKQLTKLKQTGKLRQIITGTPIRRQIYPAYATQEVMGDIDSAFNSDIGHGDKSMYGDEQYYDENFYAEDFYGNEFDNDPAYHLALKVKNNVSPLLW